MSALDCNGRSLNVLGFLFSDNLPWEYSQLEVRRKGEISYREHTGITVRRRRKHCKGRRSFLVEKTLWLTGFSLLILVCEGRLLAVFVVVFFSAFELKWGSNLGSTTIFFQFQSHLLLRENERQAIISGFTTNCANYLTKAKVDNLELFTYLQTGYSDIFSKSTLCALNC